MFAPDAGLPPNPFVLASDRPRSSPIETASNAAIACLALAVAAGLPGRLVAQPAGGPPRRCGRSSSPASSRWAPPPSTPPSTRYATATGEPLLALPEAWQGPSRGCCSCRLPCRSASWSERSGCAGPAARSSRSPSASARSRRRSGWSPPSRPPWAIPALRLVRPDPGRRLDGAPTDGRIPAPVEDDTARRDAARARRRAARGDRPRPGAARGPGARRLRHGGAAAGRRERAARRRAAGAARGGEGVAGPPRRRGRGRAPAGRARPPRRRAAAAGRRDARAPAGAPDRRDDGASPELRARLAATADELQGAIDDLRELARGIHPAILEDEGLPAAVAALARRAGVAGRRPGRARAAAAAARRVDRLLHRRRGADQRGAARAGDAGHRHASTTRATGSTVEVEDDGDGGADPAAGSGLRGLADRLAAVDGTAGRGRAGRRRHDDPGRDPAPVTTRARRRRR